MTQRERQARYALTEKGIATRKRYKRSLKGRINDNIYRARKRLEVNNG